MNSPKAAYHQRLLPEMVGAAAAGAYGYYGGQYNNGCYRDSYGNVVCPGQYPY